jgi:hypothetical protein
MMSEPSISSPSSPRSPASPSSTQSALALTDIRACESQACELVKESMGGSGPNSGGALGWPWVAVRSTDDHGLARRVIGMFGLVLGGSAGLFVGGMAATLIAALLHPFVPYFARLLLLSLTLFSLAVGAILGRQILQRETFE